MVAVDQRNHGDSFWADTQSYSDMAGDIAEVLESFGRPVDLLGHSMGGKASMVLALQRPDLIRRLIVADIAPVAYSHTQIQYIHAMRGLDLGPINKRSDADVALRDTVEDLPTRAFLLQSLDLAEKKWRLNLDTLETDMAKILSFPEVSGQFAAPTLFLSGGTSTYVKREDRPTITGFFPKARFVKIPGAGHWLHAEKPREFEAAVRTFLDAD